MKTVQQIQPDLIIPTGRRKDRNPSVASIYRALVAHERAHAYPEAVAQAHAEFRSVSTATSWQSCGLDPPASSTRSTPNRLPGSRAAP